MDLELIQRIMSGPIAEFLQTYKVLIGFMIAALYIIIIVVIAINLVRLANAPAHPIHRRKCMLDLLTAFICLVIISGFTFFYVFVVRMAFGPVA